MSRWSVDLNLFVSKAISDSLEGFKKRGSGLSAKQKTNRTEATLALSLELICSGAASLSSCQIRYEMCWLVADGTPGRSVVLINTKRQSEASVFLLSIPQNVYSTHN